MEKERWVISDTHFGHQNILKFTRADGSALRPFASIEEHDETLIANWNAVVKPHHVVYHLGDVVINRKALDRCMSRLNGKKRLIRGNHDIFKTKEYMVHFDEIYGCRVFDKFIMTHIPLHTESLGRFKMNVHGHLHSHRVMDHTGLKPDNRYYSVCVEHTNYSPVNIDTLIQYRKGL